MLGLTTTPEYRVIKQLAGNCESHLKTKFKMQSADAILRSLSLNKYMVLLIGGNGRRGVGHIIYLVV